MGMRVVLPVSELALPAERDRAEFIRWLCEPVIAQNRALIRKLGLPSMFSSGVRWQPEPWAPEFDAFELATDCLRRGWGDCDDLACWRVAELREQGDAGAGIKISLPRPHVPGGFHATVRRGDGRVEDPSRELGMGARRVA